ncbi:hypothetical protein JG687_00004500 [Phytophthora cactorum]|uniref:Uncharacterized protein n=1 Tax=Phytophthora cactorum TaxID=29920 RepID=A0A8T1UNU8_9STRA|nr:hypothetical protein JG687_00004500 [Phytophthora cactorum]
MYSTARVLELAKYERTSNWFRDTAILNAISAAVCGCNCADRYISTGRSDRHHRGQFKQLCVAIPVLQFCRILSCCYAPSPEHHVFMAIHYCTSTAERTCGVSHYCWYSLWIDPFYWLSVAIFDFDGASQIHNLIKVVTACWVSGQHRIFVAHSTITKIEVSTTQSKAAAERSIGSS